MKLQYSCPVGHSHKLFTTHILLVHILSTCLALSSDLHHQPSGLWARRVRCKKQTFFFVCRLIYSRYICFAFVCRPLQIAWVCALEELIMIGWRACKSFSSFWPYGEVRERDREYFWLDPLPFPFLPSIKIRTLHWEWNWRCMSVWLPVCLSFRLCVRLKHTHLRLLLLARSLSLSIFHFLSPLFFFWHVFSFFTFSFSPLPLLYSSLPPSLLLLTAFSSCPSIQPARVITGVRLVFPEEYVNGPMRHRPLLSQNYED